MSVNGIGVGSSEPIYIGLCRSAVHFSEDKRPCNSQFCRKCHLYQPVTVLGGPPRRICDIYDFFAPHINVLTYLLTYLLTYHQGGTESVKNRWVNRFFRSRLYAIQLYRHSALTKIHYDRTTRFLTVHPRTVCAIVN